MQPSTNAKKSVTSQPSFSQDPDVAVVLPGSSSKNPLRPPNITHLSSPAYESPLRHHRRHPSTPHPVKETLHAHSEYTNSDDDGAAIHRINQYVIKQEIGRGSFGAVHLAVDQHDCEYAVKEFSKSRLRKRAQSGILRRPHGPRPGQLAAGVGLNSPLHRRAASDIHDDEESGNPLYLIREEIAIMKKLNHPNLVSLLEVLDDPTEDSLYMVLEMCKKGVVMKIGIDEQADPYDPESCRCWFRDLILGIEYLHAQGIVHRDIKPDNLLLTEDDVLKIVDFGVSEMFEKSSDMKTAKSAGSPAFLPPELCVSKHGKVSGKAADIWSMGVTLYCLHFGKVPFEQLSVLELYESIKSDPINLDPDCEGNFADLIRKLLEKDPDKRITMPELRVHPWVTKDGADPLLPADENTANPIDPPTEEEMDRAITGNLSNLVVVMRAVRRFRGLLTKKRPYVMDSILGQDTRIFQPPLSIEEDTPSNESSRSAARPVNRKHQSDDTQDRLAVEQVFAREGIHHKIDIDDMERDHIHRTQDPNLRDYVPGAGAHADHSKAIPFTPKKQRRAGTGRVVDANTDHAKGHARDPMEEFLFLSVGPGGEDNLYETPIVSESPPAADGNIYETAYHEEVERIRSNTHDATLYLTRRVEKNEKYQNDDNMMGLNGVHTSKSTGFGKILEKAREKTAQAKDETTDQIADKAAAASLHDIAQSLARSKDT